MRRKWYRKLCSYTIHHLLCLHVSSYGLRLCKILLTCPLVCHLNVFDPNFNPQANPNVLQVPSANRHDVNERFCDFAKIVRRSSRNKIIIVSKTGPPGKESWGAKPLVGLPASPTDKMLAFQDGSLAVGFVTGEVKLEPSLATAIYERLCDYSFNSKRYRKLSAISITGFACNRWRFCLR